MKPLSKQPANLASRSISASFSGMRTNPVWTNAEINFPNLLAKRLVVDGMFNVTSSSKAAWYMLFAGIYGYVITEAEPQEALGRVAWFVSTSIPEGMENPSGRSLAPPPS